MSSERSRHSSPRRRHFGDHLQPALKEYTSLVGEVIWASNNLHSEFFTVFQVVFPGDEARTNRRYVSQNRKMAEELWHALRSDEAQRSALKAIVAHSSLIPPRLRVSILWVLDSAGKLASHRNDAVHTAFDIDWDRYGRFANQAKFSPSRYAAPKRLEKLQRIGHERLFRALIGDLNQLADYLNAIWINLSGWSGKPPYLSQRPSLKSLALSKIPPKKRRPQGHLTWHEDPNVKFIKPMPAANRRIGYLDATADEDETDNQISALFKARIHDMYMDSATIKGRLKRLRRSELKLMQKQLERGDKVIVFSFNQLGKDSASILKLVDSLKAEGVGLKSVTEPNINPFTKKGRAQLIEQAKS